MPAARTSASNLGPDSARVQLRNALAQYLHDQTPPAPAGYHRWNAAQATRPSPSLLVGDPVELLVSPIPSPPISHA
jgi:hypothetical protein